MRVLLDTHTLNWAFDDPAQLSSVATATILDPANERLFSMAGAWELAIKVSLGKIRLSLPYLDWVVRAMNDLKASLLPITLDHADAQVMLPQHHRDPFDRLMIAQAMVEKIAIVSTDSAFDPYPILRVW